MNGRGLCAEAYWRPDCQPSHPATKLRRNKRPVTRNRWWADLDRRGRLKFLSALAYTRDEVKDLNREAREILKGDGKLDGGQTIQTARGAREFAAGDRIMFLRNEKGLGVKNGTLGTVEKIGSGALQVRLDGKDETRIAVEPKDYQDLDYGYASTIHKSQGVTVDRTYVLASKYFDRHTSYVALSRHREAATVFYAKMNSQVREGRARLPTR